MVLRQFNEATAPRLAAPTGIGPCRNQFAPTGTTERSYSWSIPRLLVFDGLHLAAIAPAEVHVAAQRAFAVLIAALHGDGALRQRLAAHLDDAEPTLALLDVLEHAEIDLVREHLLDASEERAAVLPESVEKAAVHAQTGGRIDDLLTERRALVALEQFFNLQLFSLLHESSRRTPPAHVRYGTTRESF